MFNVAAPVLASGAVAVTLKLTGVVPVAGAVYRPVLSIAPILPAPVSDHVTPEVFEVNCLVAPSDTLAGLGLTVTAGGGGGPELPPPPQATSNPSSMSETHKPARAECLDTLRPTMPIINTPASGSVNGSHGPRLSARRGLTVPVLGPVVVMVKVTVVAGSPAWICLSKPQVVRAGFVFPQEIVTSLVKIPDPTGVAVKL